MRLPLRTVCIAVAIPILLGGCSSSGSGSNSSPPAGGSTAAATSAQAPISSAAAPVTSAAPGSSTASSGGVSGSWSGQYDGAFTGTFHLTWQQKSTALSGHITLSTSGTVPLNGHVNGSKISFGTVGSAAVTYEGTVDGDKMSGTYKVGGVAGGNWSAHRS
jgi:hypothetical protein